jgi:membrane-associated phospholipid phosphatase
LINLLKKNLKYLEIPDVTNQIFLLFLAVLSLIFIDDYPDKFFIPIVNIGLCLFIIWVVSHYEKKPEEVKRNRSFSRFFRFWYPVFTILFCFKEIYMIMIDANNFLYDDVLIQIDQIIFGVNPTEYLSRFYNPYLVELLQIIYALFYIMPVIYGMELYLWHRYEELKYAMFVIFFGFYLSFIGYLLVPAIGPRFTIHDFHQLNFELEGIFLSNVLRDIINFGESIPKGVVNPEEFAQRDAFPSGHTIIMILITYLSKKIKSKSFYFYLPYSILLIFSTVYLRYHYVIDLIAAIPFVLITILVAEKLYKNKLSLKKN